MARKSIKVADVLRMVNIRMGVPDRATSGLDKLTPHQAYRQGIADLLGNILHNTDNYAGFGYVGPDGKPVERYVAGETDESRRVYYVHRRLHDDYRAAQERNHREVR